MNKIGSSVVKFEEFFTEKHREDLFEILDAYPKKRSIIINYDDLEMFDPDLADLLIEKPEEIIDAAKNAIKNIDPLVKNADINPRFINVPKMELTDIGSYEIGMLVSTEVVISSVSEVKTGLKKAILECRGCMRLHEVEQNVDETLIEPILCSECGGKQFRLLKGESDYVDYQKVKIVEMTPYSKTTYPTEFILEDDMVGRVSNGDAITVTGILKVRSSKNNPFNKLLWVNSTQHIGEYSLKEEEPEDVDDDVTGERGSKEYNIWRKNVIARDEVCQCCGTNKYLQAHHIFNYKNHPEYRTNSDNGITLCKWCHGKYHSHYGKEANPVTLLQFFKIFGTSNTPQIILDKSISEEDKKDFKEFKKNKKGFKEFKKEQKLKKELQKVLDEIDVLEEEYAGQAPFNVLVSNMYEKCKIREKSVKNAVRELKHRGIIYEPTAGYLKIV